MTKVFLSNKHFKLINRFHKIFIAVRIIDFHLGKIKIKGNKMVWSKLSGSVQLNKMPDSALYCNHHLTLTTGYGCFFNILNCEILQHLRKMKGICGKIYKLGSPAKELHYILSNCPDAKPNTFHRLVQFWYIENKKIWVKFMQQLRNDRRI